MMLEIAIIEEMRTTVLEVLIKRCCKRCSTFFTCCENRFVPFDSEPGLDPFILFLIFKFKFIDFKKTKFKIIDFEKPKLKFKFIDFAKVEFKFKFINNS